MYIHIFVYTHICIHTYMYTHIFVCTFIYVYTCIFLTRARRCSSPSSALSFSFVWSCASHGELVSCDLVVHSCVCHPCFMFLPLNFRLQLLHGQEGSSSSCWRRYHVCKSFFALMTSFVTLAPTIPQSSLPLSHVIFSCMRDTARAGAAAVDMEAAKPVVPVRMN